MHVDVSKSVTLRASYVRATSATLATVSRSNRTIMPIPSAARSG